MAGVRGLAVRGFLIMWDWQVGRPPELRRLQRPCFATDDEQSMSAAKCTTSATSVNLERRGPTAVEAVWSARNRQGTACVPHISFKLRAVHWAIIVFTGCGYAPLSRLDVDTDTTVDAATEAADSPTCGTEGDARCTGNVVERCDGVSWQPASACEASCFAGACQSSASCSGGLALCGADATANCCQSRFVPGSRYSRSFDGSTTGYTDDHYVATIGPFNLDRFEVTMGRFRKFAAVYPVDKPVAGSGRNSRDSNDTGWSEAWSSSLPATQDELLSSLSCGSISTQRDEDPVRCVTWYLAQAFCIWDGGRLPTEAEWNAAASGGSEQRVYPWSNPPSSRDISQAQAQYGTGVPQRAGQLAAGDGRWGHSDLAGNVAEWVFDYYSSPYESTDCVDCSNKTASTTRAVRGGSYLNSAMNVLSSVRSNGAPSSRDVSIGFRCAHNFDN
jgi:formylglycine-generating enzyme required for sulfatase activity